MCRVICSFCVVPPLWVLMAYLDFFLQGSVPNKFYVHNDMFRYEDEVFGDSEPELDEGEVTFKVERFFHHSLRKSMKLTEAFV